MTLRRSRCIIPSAVMPAVMVVVASIVGLACSSTGPKLTPGSLAGSYTLALVTIANGSGGTYSSSPPTASGGLELTESTYKVFAESDTGLAAVPDTLASDSGTYVLRGSTLVETSATGQSADTATAALSANNDTLDLNVTAPAHAVAIYVWARTQ
jgi:hypothetical protein